jgi:hypothetical protein
MNCSVCIVNAKTQLNSDSKLSAKISSISFGIKQRLSSSSKIRLLAGVYRNSIASARGSSNMRAYENMNFAPREDMSESAIGNIRARTTANLAVKQRVSSIGAIRNTKTDKFSGSKLNFQPSSKLYPISDISFKNKFTNNDINLRAIDNGTFSLVNQTNPAYTRLDDGVFIGNYTNNNQAGSLLTDDDKTLIVSQNIFNSGDVEYKLRVTYPLAHPEFSYFALRAYAPFDNYSLRRPQKYKIYDIKLEDPSGNLVIQYNDFNIHGDNNFTTYISTPKINNANLLSSDPKYPYMDSGNPLNLENEPYTLTLNFAYDCSQFPFNDRFNFSYEQNCIINNSLSDIDNPNPFHALLISAIEIGNSGGLGIRKNNVLNFFTQVRDKSERIKKTILPTQLLTTSFDNGIYPQASSIWRTPDYEYSNQSLTDSNILLQKIQDIDYENGDFISLSGSIPYIDSGRLILKFDGSRRPEERFQGGSFRFGGNKSFNDAKLQGYFYEDYYEVDSVELRIIAKKLSGQSDYNIDVVGYSDDKLLYVTSPIGGFLQNSGSLVFNQNNVPNVSGLLNNNYGLSNSSISDFSDYFNYDVSPLGDHYVVSNLVTVDSTEFKEYIVPLEIYQNPRKLGYTKYSLSPYFEHLYLDICPIPSGASISYVSLNVYYKPANALMMHTIGSPSNKNAIQKSIILFPEGQGTITSDKQVSGIPIGFSSPDYLSSNLARRWRGNTGDIFSGGDFSRYEFDFSFNHKQSDTPFLTSYVDFTNIDDADIYDHKNNLIGQSATSLNILSNFGWRYSSDQLIDGITTDYKSTSWSSNIFDAFDRSARISSANSLEFYALNNNSFDDGGNANNILGFALFIRFSPDKVSTNDLNNCVILSYENNNKYSLALICENGILKLKIRKSDDTIVTITDTIPISNYQFPIPILITYNDDGLSYKYKLYTDNSSNLSFEYLRAESESIETYILSNNPTLRIGFSQNFTTYPALPMFLHEIGCSNAFCNILQSNPDRFINQITAKDFFDSYKVLGENIDDDISKWKLGAFKICQFSPSFDRYTKREGKDYITFSLNHHGSGYSQYTDKLLPSNIYLSGVSYHTQIENDFLRLDLSNIDDLDINRFHAIAPRISKNLPKGYNFKEKALFVDTVIEHETNNDFIWPDNNVGAKLIISLYTPTKDNPYMKSKSLGLVNRSIHYLEPSGCIRKITSRLTFDDILDKSEPWAIFTEEIYSKEFKETYFVDDINQMFLQYDVVYPSGAPYKSKIKIHNTNIRSDNAIFLGEYSSTVTPLSLHVSGAYYQFGIMNLFAPEDGTVIEASPNYINLVTKGHLPIPLNDRLNIFLDSSGFYVPPKTLNLFTIGNGVVDSSEQIFAGLFGSSPLKGMSLYVSGEFMTESTLPLYTSGMAFSASNSLNFVALSPTGSVIIDDNISLRIKGINKSINAYPFSTMPLYVYNNDVIVNNASGSIGLHLSGFIPDLFNASGNLPLVTLNYPISDSLASTSATIKWDSDNIGQGITSVDNVYAYVDSDDNIRGTDLICYGGCKQ